jgi:hypothetical protein
LRRVLVPPDSYFMDSYSHHMTYHVPRMKCPSLPGITWNDVMHAVSEINASAALNVLIDEADGEWRDRSCSASCQGVLHQLLREIQRGIRTLIQVLAKDDPKRGPLNNARFYATFPNMSECKSLVLSELLATFSIQLYYYRDIDTFWTIFTGRETSHVTSLDDQRLRNHRSFALYHFIFLESC